MPRAVILARCQFSLNQPRESPWTARSTTLRPRCRSRRRRGPSRTRCLPCGKSSHRRGPRGLPCARDAVLAGPARGAPRWPWPAATRIRSRRTSRWCAFRPPAKSVCAGLQPSSRCAWSSRWRSGGRGRGGRRPSRSPPGRGPMASRIMRRTVMLSFSPSAPMR